jgi:hypothetical protein
VVKVNFKTLDWKGAGYYGFLAPPGEMLYASPEDAELWRDFVPVLERASQGDFRRVDSLIGLIEKTSSWVVARASGELLGDAGNAQVFDRVLERARATTWGPHLAYLGYSLAGWGNLRVVPAILDIIESIPNKDDRLTLIFPLSYLLEPELGDIADSDILLDDFVHYRSIVLQKSDALAERIGREDALVLHGEEFSMFSLIEIIRRSVEKQDFHIHLRRKFEAQTGVDCSGFYCGSAPRYLTISAIVDEFVESGAVNHYIPGRRYFFGHLLPD